MCAAKAGKKRISKVDPAYIEAMQCLAVTDLPEDEGWAFEVKFDGYRCLVLKVGRKVSLVSRNNKSLNDRFPDLLPAFAALPGDFALDGEVVAIDQDGRPSFQLLQNNRGKGIPVVFYAFDFLNAGGQNLCGLPFADRRKHLEELATDFSEPVRLSALLPGSPKDILAAVDAMGLEGVVGKQLSSVYEAGERSGAWVKRRTNQQQEFVIGGYVPGSKGFDRLLLGVYEGKKLHYVAKLPNGFVDATRREIFPQLKPHTTSTCPFVNLPEPKGNSRWGEALTAEKMRECIWLKPKLVCQVGFVEWTGGGKLRHPTFIAMRDDKRPATVVRET